MHKLYMTKMPDKAGAFLTASRVIAENGGNIVRANYNKAVDTHTLFIEVDATEEQHQRINDALEGVEYLTGDPGMRQIILIELKLPDIPGSLLPALEIIKSHEVNISYINSQENGTPFQYFKMGLLVEDSTEIRGLIDDLSKLCEVHVLDYEASDRLLDSTVFYVTFANEMREMLSLSQDETNEVLVTAGKVMQTLDERKESPRRTFDNIRHYAQFVTSHSAGGFDAKVTQRAINSELTLHIIEPPCGGNVYVLEHYDSLLFVDCGMGCYEQEMLAVFENLFDGFAERRKGVIITGPDVENVGLAHLFDTIYLSRTSYKNFAYERRGKPSYRERDAQNAPYIALGKVISRYTTPPLGRCAVIGKREGDDLLELIGSIRFGNWTFQVYEGAGGHARGETVIVCPELRLVFTGNLMTNTMGLSPEQRESEALQLYLMTGVDVMPGLAMQCRQLLLNEYAGYVVCPGRGPVMG